MNELKVVSQYSFRIYFGYLRRQTDGKRSHVACPGSEIVGKEINAERTWKKIVRELERERGSSLAFFFPRPHRINFFLSLSRSLEQASSHAFRQSSKEIVV